jgi:isopentenyl diphosphate isomerase/L-lactate dehydrogenase-like FMN-dependent dehydrogenase
VLDWLEADMVRTMSLLGVTRVADLDRSLLEPGRPS